MNNLGPLGVWAFIDSLSAKEAVQFVQQLEKWGYSALWVPEAVGRDPFAIISYLAGHTEKLVFATGIANIYARDPMAMKALKHTVGELAPGRFILGLGVSHQPLVSDLRGHDYGKPLTKMKAYLEGMEMSACIAPEGDPPAPVVLGALREKMLALSAEKANGAHPYFVTPEHTKKAREIIGADALLCPEQKVLLEVDEDKARQIARSHMATYVGLPNYQNNLKTLGYDEKDFENNGSDRLVDAIVAWGNRDALQSRIRAHLDAGATHVCIQALCGEGDMGPNLETLEQLAPVNNP